VATEHLIALGHRRIAMLTGRPDLQSSQLREEGYRQALAAAGLQVDEELVQLGDYDAAISAEAARRLLDAPQPPTAVFAANAVSAIAVLDVARERRLAVPERLSVVGFDNIPESVLCSTPLTTVDQHIHEMGQRAMEMLIGLIRDEPADVDHVTLPTELVVRSSTAPPAA
jgi:LacI family transcriptional regulator, galactose operon repressor